VSKLLRSYPGLFDEEIQLDLSYIGKSLKYSKNYTLSLLERLKKMDLIILNHINTDLTLKFLQPREDVRTINRYAKNLEFILDQKKIKSLKVLQYVRETRACRKVYLIKYFSEELITDCGKCDFCKKKVNFNPVDCQKEILEILSSDSLDLDQLLLQSIYSKEELITALKFLLQKGEIVQTKFLKFKIDQ
jgi:ATP-dependent DNA helicase RecQ